MAWIYLIFAGLLEVAFTTSLKLSNNFTHRWWTLGFLISISLSFHFLNKAIQTIPIGTGYAVWTGIGAAGTAIVGIFILMNQPFFGGCYSSPSSLAQYLRLCLIRRK